MTAPQNPRDARDLEVLGLRADGESITTIARVLRLRRDIVETVLAEDRAEYPDEPLRRRA